MNPSGIITTVAGNGSAGFSGDGGAATSASLSYPIGVAVDGAGNLYIADTGNQRIRKVASTAIVDSDGDGIDDNVDNCPTVANASQTNTDGDSLGDACDPDDDGDGVLDVNDAFPLNAAEAVDTDGDGTGNNADTDDDNDGVADTTDAFPLDASESVDTDNDGTGNNADTDDDNDNVADEADAFPLDPSESIDTDGDSTGDNADLDDDNDGTPDSADAFPLNAAESVDTDGDGVGNNADPDDDGDGVNDANDTCALVSGAGRDADGNGCTDSINDLAGLIQSFHLRHGMERRLLAIVDAAIAKVAVGDKDGAIRRLAWLFYETQYYSGQHGWWIPYTQSIVLGNFLQNVIAGLQGNVQAAGLTAAAVNPNDSLDVAVDNSTLLNKVYLPVVSR